MAAVYQLNGKSVYEYNGVIYDATTGQPISSVTASSAPPVVTATPPAATTTTATTTPTTPPTPAATTPAPLGSPELSMLLAQQAQKLGVKNVPQSLLPGVTPSPVVPNTTTINTSGTTSTDTSGNITNVIQAAVAAAINAAQVSQQTGSTFPGGLPEALKSAANDPTIIAKYSDALKMDTATFQQGLQQLQQATSTAQQNQQTQFENERRQLAEQYAAQGAAYSGFRGRAQEQLAQQEQGIVTSSRAAAQKSLQDLTTQFEQKYGSAMTTAATMPFLDPYAASGVSLSGLSTPDSPNATQTMSGTLTGGITGTQYPAQQADIRSLAGQYMNQGSITPTVPLNT